MNNNHSMHVLNGIDSLINTGREFRRYKKIGLVSNSKAFTSCGRLNLTALADAGFTISRIFSPEHGYFADIRDGDYIEDSEHPVLKTPILSLFTEGHTRNAAAEAAKCGAVDAFIFDVQDAGVRFYTYIHALSIVMRAALDASIPIIVADRINPIGVATVEGAIPDPDFYSELCPFPIPIRYALTIGELSKYLAASIYKGVQLEIVPITGGYQRNMVFEETDLQWRAPSPAMISPATALFYPGTCLFEGINISEGRGTSAPFQTIGAPFLKPESIIENFYYNLKMLGIKDFDNVKLSEIIFTPSSSWYENTLCRGISLKFKPKSGGEKHKFKSLLYGMLLLKTIYDNVKSEAEFLFGEKSRKYFIDRLCGGSSLRETIINKKIYEVYELYLKWSLDADKFKESTSFCQIYECGPMNKARKKPL